MTYSHMTNLQAGQVIDLKSDHVDTKVILTDQAPPGAGILRPFMKVYGMLFPNAAAKLAWSFFTKPRMRATHSRTDDLLDSAIRVIVNDGEHDLMTYSWGDQDAPIVMLCHGWQSRGTALRMFVPQLLENGYRVVAMDAPAHGESTGDRCNLLGYATSIASVIDTLPNLYGAICHSFGCNSLSYAFTRLRPNREIKRVVLVAMWVRMIDVFRRFQKQVALPEKVFIAIDNHLSETYSVRMVDIDFSKLNLGMQIESIMVVHDKQDPIMPLSDAATLAEHWDNTHVLAPDGYGHFRLVKNPDVIQAITEFIVE